MSAAPDSFDTGLRPGDVDPARPHPIETPWGSMSIFSCAGALFATQSFCPHLMGPLFHGTMSGEEITCPWHQWRFSLRTGRRVDEPDGRTALLVCDVVAGPLGTLVLSRPRRNAALAPTAP